MRTTAMLIMLALLTASRAEAENVDLVTLPQREGVQLTIYNSVDLTLVRETRFVTFKKGANRLQFSWANTLIDPTSVEIRVLENADKIDVVDTKFPGQKPEHLIWNIQSDVEGQVPVAVSYFTSGLSWQMDYVAVVEADESSLGFQGYVRVSNQSGEEYEDAEIRLIVGKINLVERIEQLARRSGEAVPKSETRRYADYRNLSLKGAIADADKAKYDDEKKAVVKEGVSEYFMFSIEGTETVQNGWSKRIQAVDRGDVDFDIVYRLRTFQYGPRPVRFFNWKNDPEHSLGESPLPNGLVRLFRKNANDGLNFLGQQSLNYVPVGAPIEINLGTDDLVSHRQTNKQTKRSDFSFHPQNRQVTGWNEKRQSLLVVRNYHSKPIQVEIRLRIAGDIEFSAPYSTKSFDFNTVDTRFEVPPLGQFSYGYDTLQRHQSNVKQNRVLIKKEL